MVDQEKVEAPPSGSARTNTPSWSNESVNIAVVCCVDGPRRQVAPSLPSVLCSGPISSRKETTSGHRSPHPAGCEAEGKDIGTEEKNKRFGKKGKMSLWGLKLNQYTLVGGGFQGPL